MSTSAVVKAKRFLINRIVDQAKRADVPLTEVEIAMLGFVPSSASLKERDAAAVFKRDYEEERYEAKIGRLFRDVYELDKNMGRSEVWEQSLDSLADEDMYLAVIIRKIGLRQQPTGPWYLPEWRTIRELVPTIALVGAGIVIVFTPFGENLVPNPILRTVVALCFWLSPWLISKLTKEDSEQGTVDGDQ